MPKQPYRHNESKPKNSAARPPRPVAVRKSKPNVPRPAREELGPRKPGQDAQSAPPENIVFGRNAVRETLKTKRPVEKMLVAEGLRGETTVRVLVATAIEQGVDVQTVPRSKLDMLCQGNHQGVAIFAQMVPYKSLDDLLEIAAAREEEPWFLALDGLEDPHNLGALLRVCDCAGVHGIIIPKRRAAGLTPAAVRTASGAAEYVPVAQVVNLHQALLRLKEEGITVIGAQMGKTSVFDAEPGMAKQPLCVVLGGEGKGLTRLIAETCDMLLGLPMKGKTGSLNAATAGAAFLYEILRQKDIVSTA
ncbi:MAG: 23S rRNA (guanosine(2251)-2'-O)-methyltransferase RlmB [Clostridia bacterium]|nr:23S rRNA (guanosine(2251)-2'-O)-methyltransferase RlmB [Clostridia bacterium]